MQFLTRLSKEILAQIDTIPITVYESLFSLFIIGTVILLALYKKKAAEFIARLLLIEYLFIVFGQTVIFRNANPKVPHFLVPFWSYISYFQGECSLLYEIIMNVVLFIPVGFLWGTQTSKHTSKQQWLVAFLLGTGLSLGIELLQLAFKKGSFEIDDIIHNTLGCLMGFALWRGAWRLVDVLKRKVDK